MLFRYSSISWGCLLTMLLDLTTLVTAQEMTGPAPELRPQSWINTDLNPADLTLKKLEGRVVILLFFTADDPNSTAALEQAQRLKEIYRHQPLEIIGVHSPPKRWRPARFPQEQMQEAPPSEPLMKDRLPDKNRSQQNSAPSPPGREKSRKDRSGRIIPDRGGKSLKEHIRAVWKRHDVDPLENIIKKQKLSFPILLDHDRYVWTKYRIVAYPTFQLIEQDGLPGIRIVGIKGYKELSTALSELLNPDSRKSHK